MLFAHIAGVFGFLLAHGSSMTIAFRLRTERDRERIRLLLQLSGSTARVMYLSLLVIVGAGLRLTFLTPIFKTADWVWISLGLLVAITIVMLVVVRPYYRAVAEACLLRPSGVPRVSDEELDAMLRSTRPMVAAGLGFATLLAILYMMIFKQPF